VSAHFGWRDSIARTALVTTNRGGDKFLLVSDEHPSGRCAGGHSRVRAVDADAMVIDHDLVEGRQLVAGIDKLFADPRVAYLHVHFAAAGLLQGPLIRRG